MLYVVFQRLRERNFRWLPIRRRRPAAAANQQPSVAE
jgi:hypothetical protein